MNTKYLLNFLIIGFKLAVELELIFKNIKAAPAIGRTPKGSGELKSLNHKNPSVIIPGYLSKLYEKVFTREIHVI